MQLFLDGVSAEGFSTFQTAAKAALFARRNLVGETGKERKSVMKDSVGKLTRRSDGVLVLRFKGQTWQRGDFNDYGQTCAGPVWWRRRVLDGQVKWCDEPKDLWELLDQKAVQLRDLQREAQKSPNRSEPQEITRTKYGVRIYSNDGKHFFGIGVWKSRKYPGHTSIRLFVAGRNTLYTINSKYLKALVRELSRSEPT